jgi:signal transduction histidine kinase
VAPAAIVAALGYVSLRQWQVSAELLLREQARDMAAMAADKVEMVLRRADDDMLTRLQETVATGIEPRRLDAFLAATPLVRRLYLFDGAGALLYPRPPAPDDAKLATTLLREVSRPVWERGGRRAILVGDEAVVAGLLRAPDGGAVLAVACRDVDAVRRDVFAPALGGLEAPSLVAVLDQADRPVYARAPVVGAERVAVAPFREAFPGWRLALYQAPGASPRDSVRRQVMLFTGALGVLVVVIVAGVLATWRLVRRETEMARLKSDFVANVSHDLKTPLSVIRMFGETLEMGRVADEPRRREYYRVITRESERLSRLIDNVLDFSRIEGGRRRYERVPTAVEPLVRDTLAAFEYPLAQQGFKVDVDIASDLPDVAVDPDAVGQALANLVDNAIKYSGDERVLRVTAARVGDEVAISVVDHGIGIAAGEHARIFEKFYRVGRSDTVGRRGSGVGLALVRHVAEAHGGRVTVESRPGAGSCFTLWLPLASPEP